MKLNDFLGRLFFEGAPWPLWLRRIAWTTLPIFALVWGATLFFTLFIYMMAGWFEAVIGVWKNET